MRQWSLASVIMVMLCFFQLFVFFYMARCHKITKSTMSKIGALNFWLLLDVIVFCKVYMLQYFIVFQVRFYFIIFTILVTLNVDILLKDINLSIESLVSILTTYQPWLLYLGIDSHPFIVLTCGSRIYIWGSVVLPPHLFISNFVAKTPGLNLG